MPAERRARHLAYLMLAVAPLFWSGNVILGRGLYEHIPPVAFNFWRWVGALVILLPLTGPSLIRQRAVIRRHWFILAILGLTGVTLFNTLGYLAMRSTTAINISLINASLPIFVAIMAWAGFRDRVTGIHIVGMVLSISGTILVVLRGDIATVTEMNFATGDLLIVGAVILYGLYTILLRLRPKELDQMTLLAAITLFGVVAALPLYVAETMLVAPMPVDGKSLLAIAYVAALPSVLAYVFWNRGVETVGPNKASLFANLMPVYGALLAVWILGETLHGFHFAGFALIFVGIVLATRPGGAPGMSRTPGRTFL